MAWTMAGEDECCFVGSVIDGGHKDNSQGAEGFKFCAVFKNIIVEFIKSKLSTEE